MKKLTPSSILKKYSPPYTQLDSDSSFYSWHETQVLLKSNYVRSLQNQKPRLKHEEAPLRLITSGEQLSIAIAAISNSKVIGIDCETTGLDPNIAKVRLIQIAIPRKPVLIIDLAALAENELEPLRHLLASNCLKVGHNLKFELMMLERAGFRLKPPFFDTYLGYKVLTAGLKKISTLEILAAKLLRLKLNKDEQKSDFRSRLTQSQLQYAANDAAVVLPLYRKLKHKLKAANLFDTAQDEFDCLPSVARMELNGIKLDLKQWLKLGDYLRERQQQLQRAIDLQLNSNNQFQQLPLAKELNPSINLRSPTQVIRALNNIGISVKSTSASELVFLAPKYPIIEQLLEYRSIATRISTFSEGLPNFIHPVTNRIHGNWFQLGARSGRFSCSKPNLTNIPRDFETRSCFVASPGKVLIKADYSQIELRLIAKISGDKRMCRAYQQGRDLHRLTAAHIFNTDIDTVTDEQRRLGKIVNFGLIYGMGAKKFCITTARDYGIYLKTEEAKLFRDRYLQLYQGIADYHILVRKQWQKGVRVSRTIDGRRRLWSKQNPPTLNEMLNYPIQGTNATILKRAIASVDRLSERQQLDINLIAVVHDEILLECPNQIAKRAANLLSRCMLDAARPLLDPIPVIVDVKIADSWR